MKNLHYVFHSLAYYLAWFFCIKLAAQGYAFLSAFIVIACVLLQIYWQYKIQHNTRGLFLLLSLVVCVSTLVDSLMVFNGIIIFAANPFAPYFTAPWIITIWISFTVVLYSTLSRLFAHLVLLSVLSFFGFALSFAVGAKMGAAYFPYGYQTCFLIGAIWFILLPLIVFVYQRIEDTL